MLRGGDFESSQRGHGGSNPAHLRLMEDLMTHGTLGLAEADGHCFTRVVWGYGAHVLYYDTLVVMRRLVGDFTHRFIQKVYKLPVPVEFAAKASSRRLEIDSNQDQSVNSGLDFGGLKIVYFTRGSSGKGRTMQGEASLVQELRDRGALVVFCCDFSKATLEDQLSMAVHADVVRDIFDFMRYFLLILYLILRRDFIMHLKIMGLHGAAMVHGFFMRPGGLLLELKTLYGFTSGLFHLAMDARRGILGQVDVREYFIRGGHRPVDSSLIDRTLHVLSSMVQLKRNMQSSNTTAFGTILDTNPTDELGTNGKRRVDVVVSSCTKDTNVTDMFHFLGPPVSNMVDMCRQTVLYRFRHEILGQSSEDLHCAPCSPFNAR